MSPGSPIWTLAHHLADDDLEVLVVDLHALQTIHGLDLVDDVLLRLHRTEDVQDVGRGDAAVGQAGACANVVVLLDQDLLGRRDLVGLLDTGTVLHPDDTLAALDLVHEDLAVDLGDDGGIGRWRAGS